ncbi:M23 family metallopeptidase [Kocuria sp. M1R5S2]|uniref:M23 family metallopeptidase n=1 Tax=Kocuria rhizosphaerae TaxID=3376285 RepID=UPI00379A2E2E
MRHRSSRARHSTSGARHRSSGGSHRSTAPRSRMPRPALPLGEHLGRPAVVCSLAVVALGVSSVLTQGAPSSPAASSGGSSVSMVSLLQGGSGGALVASPAGAVGAAGTSGPGQRAGTSPLDPAGAAARVHEGELPVNTIVAPAQPATVLEGGRFGWRIAPDLGVREFHNGTDLSVAAGTPVVAAAQGRVTAVFWDVWGGNRVEVAHADGLRTTYSHLEDVRVEVGDELAAAQRLGSVGATGIRVTGPHLHFETWVDGAVADPQSFDWITDAGIVPGTATPYSLAEDAPSPAEVSELLRRSLSGGNRVQVMASAPAETPVAQRPRASAPRDIEKDTEKDTAGNTAKNKSTAKSTVERAPATTPEPSAEAAPRSKPAEPSAAAPAPAPAAPAPQRTPDDSVKKAAEQEAAEKAAELEAAEQAAAKKAAEQAAAEKAAAERAAEAAKRAEELRQAQLLHASPTVDTDGDGVVDSLDDDLDGDGIANALDTDIDGDGILNTDEAEPRDVWTPATPRTDQDSAPGTTAAATEETGAPAGLS